MKIFLVAFFLFQLMAPSATAEGISDNTKTAAVFIANYDKFGNFKGWGSGFFVDEGIVVTNKHVIEGKKQFKIFGTGIDGNVDFNCGKIVTKADMKINLEDDVAYIRVYLENCDHGVVHFAKSDPELGAPVSVVGFPSEDTSEKTLELSETTGHVTGYTYDEWLRTDAYMHSGNSGGPVVHNGLVVGVAVAKGVDSQGNFTTGYFIPNSVIIKGLLYANNSTFGYTAQDLQENYKYDPPEDEEKAAKREAADPFDPVPTGDIASNLDCRRSLGEGGESTGVGGCKCKRSYHPNAARTTCLPGAPGWEDPNTGPAGEKMARTTRLQQRRKLLPPTTFSHKEEEKKPPTIHRPTDVSDDAWYGDALDVFTEQGAIDVTEAFRPSNNATRGEFIRLLVKSIITTDVEDVLPPQPSFDDVPRHLIPFFEEAAAHGWVKGEGDCYGTHPCNGRPNASINRAEAATLIMRAFGLESTGRGPRFSDVQTGAWYKSSIDTASALCILRGDAGKTTVRPGDHLNRAEMVTMVGRATKKSVYPNCT